jgi:hypothetical protein
MDRQVPAEKIFDRQLAVEEWKHLLCSCSTSPAKKIR